MKKVFSLLFVFVIFTLYSHITYADEAISKEGIDVVWIATASALVFFMQAGFALLESGSCRTKNSINIVMKNYLDLCVGSIIFWMFGFALMFGNNSTGWFGHSEFFLHDNESRDYSFLLFQTMFAATAATIASGAMAERTKFSSYLIVAVLITGIIYPIYGSWAWGSAFEGKGWLADIGFIDFAGSTVVHSTGGWCALAAIIILGPRLGRFDPIKKTPRDIPGHNANYVALGGFILWFGWFGFNGGSTLGADANIGLINLNTQLSAAAGAAGVLLLGYLFKLPVIVHNIVNGSLAGLVGITAGCATMEPVFAIITGFSSGMIYLAGTKMLISFGLDDVVGAVSVHAFAGAWGTLCAGLFLKGNMFDATVILTQVLGIGACFFWAFGSGMFLFYLVNKVIPLRAETLHEQRGLDFTEHSEIAYPEFMQDSYYTKSNFDNINR